MNLRRLLVTVVTCSLCGCSLERDFGRCQQWPTKSFSSWLVHDGGAKLVAEGWLSPNPFITIPKDIRTKRGDSEVFERLDESPNGGSLGYVIVTPALSLPELTELAKQPECDAAKRTTITVVCISDASLSPKP
jgi:hypothetical protein